MGYPFLVDQDGYSGAKPPWGELMCLDLATGEYRWRTPLGTDAALEAKGIKGTGTYNIGGTIVTKGGLLFVAATQDANLRAIDSATGKVLWEHKLPTGGFATPCTYAVNGKQYVVIACGGANRSKLPPGDEFVAFSLG